jgi:hypothetical protein
VPTNDPVYSALQLRKPNDCILKGSDIVDGVLNGPLRRGTQRPKPKTHETPHPVKRGIQPQQYRVTNVPYVRQPLAVLDNSVQFVPMDDEKPATVCSLMNGTRLNRDSPVVTEKPTNKLVMIPRDIHHTRTFPPRSEYFLNHIVVVLRPVNSAL